ncbi:MAG: tetratricopeptide repeat protein [Pantoea sp. Brub]|nr:tetratricopeptide repeat protein [Pantoea sp. Brub]
MSKMDYFNMYIIKNRTLNKIQEFFLKNKMKLSIGMIVIGILLVIISVIYLSNNHESNSLKTKHLLDKYQEIINLINIDDIQNNFNKINNFINDNQNIFGIITAMNLSKYYIDNNEINKAGLLLNKISKNIHDSNLQSIIDIRLARIENAQNNFSQALKILNNIKDNSWKFIISNIRSEALLGQEKKELARYELIKGMHTYPSFDILKKIMQIKANNLNLDN